MNNEQPITFEEMYNAYQDCRQRKKNTPGAKKYELYEFFNTQKLVEDINNRTYKLRPSQCFIIKYPVPREVFCASFRDRIVQHFVYNELNPLVEKSLIRDTASCRVGKGTDYAIRRLGTFVRRETNNYTETAFYGKGDLKGFFMSLDRETVLRDMVELIDTKYQGVHAETLKYLLKIIILTDVTIGTSRLCNRSLWELLPKSKSLFGNDHGLPIGNITSQMFANYYLNDFDHFIKSRHKSYVRYVDDFIIVDKDKSKIKETLTLSEEILSTINQKLNAKKTKIKDVKYGIPFLGVVVKPYYTSLGKKRINRLYYTTRLLKTPDEFWASASCRKGMFQRYHGYNLSRRWYESQPPIFKENVIRSADYRYHLVDKSSNKELIKM